MSAKQQGKDPMIGPYKDMDTPKGLDEAGVWMPDREKTDKRNSLIQNPTKNAAYKAKEGEFQSPTSGKESRSTMHLTETQKSDMYKYAGLGAVAVGGIYTKNAQASLFATSDDPVPPKRPASGKQSRPTFRLTREQKSGMYKRAGLGAVAMDGSSFFLFYATKNILEK